MVSERAIENVRLCVFHLAQIISAQTRFLSDAVLNGAFPLNRAGLCLLSVCCVLEINLYIQALKANYSD